jgi:hypothetical protein
MFRIAEESSWLERSRSGIKRAVSKVVPLGVQGKLGRAFRTTAGDDA